MIKRYEVTAENADSFSAREIIESMVTNPGDFIVDREHKYFLGDVVASKCLHCQVPNSKEKKYEHI